MTFRMSQAQVDAYENKLAQWRRGDVPKQVGRKGTVGPCEFRLPEVKEGILSVTLPIRLVNLANEREHWRDRAKRAKAQREIVAQAVPRRFLPPVPAIVRITRMGPRFMDDDGNVVSGKNVRDAIAGLFNLDDGSPLLKWEYAQEKGDYGVRLEFRPCADKQIVPGATL